MTATTPEQKMERAAEALDEALRLVDAANVQAHAEARAEDRSFRGTSDLGYLLERLNGVDAEIGSMADEARAISGYLAEGVGR